jgi:hypothetical protein
MIPRLGAPGCSAHAQFTVSCVVSAVRIRHGLVLPGRPDGAKRALDHRVAAVDGPGLAGYIARFVAGEKHCQCSNFFRFYPA